MAPPPPPLPRCCGRPTARRSKTSGCLDRPAGERRGSDGAAQPSDLHASGDGVAQDYEQAAYWFREAAIQGVPNAQYNLGVLYENGWGVEKSDVRSLLWYHSAAESGHPKAQYNLGIFFEGRGNPVNFREARRWFERAGIANQPGGFFNLARMEEEGLGAAPNIPAARHAMPRRSSGGTPRQLRVWGSLGPTSRTSCQFSRRISPSSKAILRLRGWMPVCRTVLWGAHAKCGDCVSATK